jgi:hypothetical protein
MTCSRVCHPRDPRRQRVRKVNSDRLGVAKKRVLTRGALEVRLSSDGLELRVSNSPAMLTLKSCSLPHAVWPNVRLSPDERSDARWVLCDDTPMTCGVCWEQRDNPRMGPSLPVIVEQASHQMLPRDLVDEDQRGVLGEEPDRLVR